MELPDLPLELTPQSRRDRRGHYMPTDFDRRLYKVLFTKVRTHVPTSSGKAIVTKAYGRDPLLLVKVNIESEQITGIETPHPMYGGVTSPRRCFRGSHHRPLQSAGAGSPTPLWLGSSL